MLFLILFLLIAAGVVYLAQYNLTPVTLVIGYYTFSGIPLFYVLVGSLLTGLILGYIVQLINSFFVNRALKKKDSKIKSTKETIAELSKRIHQLELENERLRKDSPIIEVDEQSL